jgi:hypothetical protein
MFHSADGYLSSLNQEVGRMADNISHLVLFQPAESGVFRGKSSPNNIILTAPPLIFT